MRVCMYVCMYATMYVRSAVHVCMYEDMYVALVGLMGLRGDFRGSFGHTSAATWPLSGSTGASKSKSMQTGFCVD
jgi:hypothetical protein